MTLIKSSFTPTLPSLFVTRTIMTNCWRQRPPPPWRNRDKFQKNLMTYDSTLEVSLDVYRSIDVRTQIHSPQTLSVIFYLKKEMLTGLLHEEDGLYIRQ